MYPATSESPKDEGINRPERELALVGPDPGAVDIVQDPRDLGSRKIRIKTQPGFFCQRRFRALVFQRLTI